MNCPVHAAAGRGLQCLKRPFTALSLEEIGGHLNSRRFLLCAPCVVVACFSK